MRKVYRYRLPNRHAKPLVSLQARWSRDTNLRATEPKWKEPVWRGVYRTFLQRIHGLHCAFCEIAVSGWRGEVEHFFPKVAYPRHKFDWTNWILSCKNCNLAKGIRDTKRQAWLDPRVHTPSAHLEILPTGALQAVPSASRKQRKRATNTIVGADLNCVRTKRPPQLVAQRQRAIAALDELLGVYAQLAGNPGALLAMDAAIVRMCTDANEQFSGVRLCHLHRLVDAAVAPRPLLDAALRAAKRARPSKTAVFARSSTHP